MARTLYDPANDEQPDMTLERCRQKYAWERKSETEKKIERDEIRFRANQHPKPKLSKAEARLVRRTEEVARERFEEAARSEDDFLKVVAIWDRIKDNRERRERYHESLRGDFPIDYKMAYDAMIFPEHYMNPAAQLLNRGYFLDDIFDCPFEMQELTSDKVISKAIYELKDEHKELLYFLVIRLYSTTKLALVRGQSDRNIRKVRTTVMKKLRKPLYAKLKKRENLNKRERQFLVLYDALYAPGSKMKENEDEELV